MIPRGTPILASPSPFQRNFGGLVLGCIDANCTWDTWRRSFSVWLKPIFNNRFTEKGHTPKTKINSVKWFWHLRRVWLPVTVPLFYDAFPSIILGSMIPRGTPILASPSPFQRNFGGLVLGCIDANCTWDTWRRSFSVWLKPIFNNRFTEKGHTPKTKINSVKWFWHLRRV